MEGNVDSSTFRKVIIISNINAEGEEGETKFSFAATASSE